MKNWKEYKGHLFNIKSKIDDTIYTFDIETTSYIILDGKQYEPLTYLDFDKKTQEKCQFQSFMYIWQFGINDVIYYGRTWQDFISFLEKLEYYTKNSKKICFVHNLSFEFEFMRNCLKFKDVYARKSRKVMKCSSQDFNIEFRCTLFMSNLALKKLPQVYNLPVEKLVGDLDYNIIRHNKSKLSKKELKYCENDCLVVYEYIKRELEKYKTINKIPITSTGHVRKELKNKIFMNFKYKYKVKRAINIDGHFFDLMQKAFAGGYTHANYIYADEIIKEVDSFDETSAYPYVMVTRKISYDKI